MNTPTAREVREGVADLLAEVAWARSRDGLLADLTVAILAGHGGRALEGVRRLGDLLRVVEAALGAVQLPQEDGS